MSEQPHVSSPAEYADAVRRAAKDQWFEFETNRRRQMGISMTEPISPWQVWNADPSEPPVLVAGADEQPSGFAYTKLFPAEAEINRFLTFRPAVVVSNSQTHALGRALICPLTRKPHERSGNVTLEPAPHRKHGGMVLTGRLRSVNGDTNEPLESRELLCINSGNLARLRRVSCGDAVVRRSGNRRR